jgi:hypothetical protein
MNAAPLSAPVETIDGSGSQGARKRQGVNEYIYLQVPANTPAGTPLIVTYDGDEEVMVKGVAPATLAVYQEVAVNPKLAGSAAEFQWCQTRGICEVLCDGTTDIAKDDYLELLNTETALVKDSTARSVNSVAIACEAYTLTPDALTTVQLLGDRVIIAAS